MRGWIILSSGVSLALLLVALLFLRAPTVGVGENGLFGNDCCGTVELVNGEMLLNDKQITRYVVAEDADGPYILPRTSVGVVSDRGLDVDGTRSVMKLRIDKLPRPSSITLYEGPTSYVFVRKTPRPLVNPASQANLGLHHRRRDHHRALALLTNR